MGKVSDRARALLAKQVNDHGIVVWYDPDKSYGSLVQRLNLPDTQVVCLEDGYFHLRQQLDQFLEFVMEDGRPTDNCGIPPRLVVYVPRPRAETDFALIEPETAGVVMEPGAPLAECNTRLSALGEQVFMDIAPEKAAHVARQADEGLLMLEELDQMAEEAGSSATGALRLTFGPLSPVDILLSFVSTDHYDQKLEEKRGLSELGTLLREEVGFEIAEFKTPSATRSSLQRHLLLGELILTLPENVRSGALATVALPPKPVQEDTLRHVCRTWRNRVDLAAAYEKAAEAIEKQAQLSGLALPAADIRGLQTFPFIEGYLLKEAETALVNGAVDEALTLARQRRDSFWSRERPKTLLRWSLVEVAGDLLQTARTIREALKHRKRSAHELVEAYALHGEPWLLLDQRARHLESRYASFEGTGGAGEEGIDTLMVHCRKEYLNTVSALAEQYCNALENDGFHLANVRTHSRFFHDTVSPALTRAAKTACFFVDALRYEMAAELVEGLKDDFDVRLEPAVGQLPGITAVGMAALLPKAEASLSLEREGTGLAVCVEGHVVTDRAARLAWLLKQVAVPAVTCKLSDVVRLTPKRKKELQAAQLIVVTSQEIDRHGEEAGEEPETRLYMDEVLEKLRRAIRSLAQAGVQELLLAADHGFIHLEGLDEGLKMDPPGGQTVDLHPRVWIGQGGRSAEGYVRVNASDLELGGPLELAFPRGLATFKVKGGSGTFFHGGLTLQEHVIPICRLTLKKIGAQKAGAVKLTLSLAKPTITNRFFSVTAQFDVEGLFHDVQKRIRLELASGKDLVGTAAMASYGFEEGTREITIAVGKPNPVTMMITTTAPLERVHIRAVDCETQLQMAVLNDVPVELTI